MEQTSVIYYEDPDTGKYEVLQAIYGGSNSTFVEYDDIPKNLINACIAIEDKRFEKHQGRRLGHDDACLLQNVPRQERGRRARPSRNSSSKTPPANAR